MTITDKLIKVNEYNRPGTAQTPAKICVHYTGDPGATAAQLAAFYGNVAAGVFKDKPNSWTSAQYVIGMQGEILRIIPDDEIAYAASGKNNGVIHIEVCHADSTGNFSEESIVALEELVRSLMSKYNISTENVVRHYDLTGKRCPAYYVDSTRWAALHERITTSQTTDGKLYRVQVGAFKNKTNAESYMQSVKKAGFNAFIVEVNT
jgi:N-acetylmuramoyl-L-alanine amidase CwlA